MDSVAEKDIKYLKHYQPNDKYWGLGIENETYFIINNGIEKTGMYIKKNRRRERYSVDYSRDYDQDKLMNYLNKVFLDNDKYIIPIYVNSHTLSKTDTKGEHLTLYVVGKKFNPKFNGKTLQDIMFEKDPLLKSDFEHRYVFDGDTIEFITQDFYKTTTTKCVQELIDYKKNFLTKLNTIFTEYNLPILSFPKVNYGLVQFRTNPNNISIFNNGTYHINITMPTKLDSEGKIADWSLFESKHRNAIRLLQWIEPLIISLYGSPDVFSFDNERYSAGSLRLTASRYIGVGTYDTQIMKRGKILNDPKTSMFAYIYKNSWFNKIYESSDYNQGDNMGYDFNYAKHYNAGIEFRILDYFPEEALPDIINFIILLLDHSLNFEVKTIACESPEWNDWVVSSLKYGYLADIPKNLSEIWTLNTGLPAITSDNTIDVIHNLSNYLYEKYRNSKCSAKMSPEMTKPVFHNINAYMWHNNFLQYIPINNMNHPRILKLYNVYQNLSSMSQKNDRESILLLLLLQKAGLDRTPNLPMDVFFNKLLDIAKTKLDVAKYKL